MLLSAWNRESGYNVGIWYRWTKTGVSGDNQRHVSNIWQAVVVEIINDLKNVLLILRHMGVEYVFYMYGSVKCLQS
jgi:hypothetical protein